MRIALVMDDMPVRSNGTSSVTYNLLRTFTAA